MARPNMLNAEDGQVLTFRDAQKDKTHKVRLGTMAEIGDVICYAVQLDAESDPRVLVQRDDGFFLDNLTLVERVAGSGS